MISAATQHESGHRFHACFPGLRQALLVLAEVDDFHVEPRRIKRGSLTGWRIQTKRLAQVGNLPDYL
jgi:hypothetical protein